jgi:hypothetical protein
MSSQPNQNTFPRVILEVEQIQADQFDPETWNRAVLERRSIGTHVPGYGPPPLPSGKPDEPRFSGRDTKGVVVKETAIPDPGASVGFAGPAIVVESQSALIDGHLFVPVEGAEKKGIAKDSIRVFRWVPDRQEFEIVVRSGLVRGAWACAEINIPGIYVPIGLPRDPIASRLLKVGWTLSDLTHTSQGDTLGILLKEVGTALFNGLEPLVQGRDRISALPAPGAPNSDLPDYQRGDARVDPPIVLGVLGRGASPPEYQILANPSTIHRVQDLWEFVAPRNIAGMSLSVVIDPSQPEEIYTCSADGGVWRLGGASGHPYNSWEPITDALPLQRTQAFAVAPTDGRVLYVQMQDGVLYRSTNYGVNWSVANRDNFGVASRILVDPSNADRVYLATRGGLWRSDDGGRTWAMGGPLVSGDATDFAIDSTDFDVIYVAIRGVGLLRSRNRGQLGTWTTIIRWDPMRAYWTDPAQRTTAIRLSLGVSGPPSARRIAAKFGQEVFYNTSGGDGMWTSLGMVGGPQPQHGAGYYFGQGDWAHCIAIDPFDESLILAGQDMLYRRRADSGAGWQVAVPYYTPLEDGHPDYHGITFDATLEGVVYVANDGGVYRSDDHGATWRYLGDGLNTLQVWFHTGIPGGALFCGAYHYGMIGSARPDVAGWQVLGGGAWEFSSAVADVQRPGTFYVFDIQNSASGIARATLSRAAGGASVTLELEVGWATFNTTAVAMDPRPSVPTMLAGGRADLFRARDRIAYTGRTPTWTAESIALDPGDSVASIAYSTPRSGDTPVVYVVTARAVVYRNRNVDGGGVWERRGQWIGADPRDIAVNSYDPHRIYIAAWNAGLARSEDGGTSFSVMARSGSAPFFVGTNYSDILTHPNSARTLIAATNFGIYISTDEGATWRRYGAGLPNVQVVHCFVDGPYVYAATHGRGLWRHSLM